ncbi:MAG: HAD-IIA family hydrolase [Halobacteriales archaeon]
MTGDALQAAVLDLDGTVLRGDESIPGAAEGIAALRSAGLELVFLTNNPLRRADEWVRLLGDHGIDADPGAVVTSMDATVAYLREHHAGATFLPVAGDAIVEQVREAGFDLTEERDRADVVLAGYDEEFHYDDLLAGLRAMRAGVPLVGTDPDRWVPTDEGPIPGSGAVVNAVAGAAELEPEAVLGKPSQVTVDLALDRAGCAPESCLLVGDRLDTDVAMGEQAGMETALVLTGASDGVDGDGPTPDHVLDSLGEVDRLL